ncbi:MULTISPECIES: L-tyrosine/L-tryptophan isonitrile synthase family protein [Streptomyces]|uniref:L-tyrosine/L-tryptophan isonitrile synthase family protein n=1 Tax=Streptomyces TaxID=1883 RepID=UPI00163C68FE|nr:MULTISPECIES: isocyanide synthase family protein [Streptomyces]MBC2879293.1 L-tyrosine/L-tryptophan isonitrile synthase family protein [Streptomyces sp. TYQ1024]UBI40109.1 isocyanide synthase family protein [Streptomyces mobaraensis]UKW32688.1 isocyanide synthase family protein [Streptomyces sp. TYQ1024]
MTTTSTALLATDTATEVLRLLLPYHRTTGPVSHDPADHPETLRQIRQFTDTGDPVVLTLPGFPCKSPNPAKVLGHLPDEGERLSLTFLDHLCARVGEVYEPGARIVICSDGHIFGDVIHVPDEHIDAYGDALRAMIDTEGLRHLDTFDLRAVHGDADHDTKRRLVTEAYAPSVDDLRALVRTDEETARLYRGITRFLFEDTADFPGSRSALQRDCRARAYEVIARSRAWGELIAQHFPRQVRLSIHPQPAGAEKFGIRLLETGDAWATPWHTVLLLQGGAARLVRREEAERVGRLVVRDGRPSHFVG